MDTAGGRFGHPEIFYYDLIELFGGPNHGLILEAFFDGFAVHGSLPTHLRSGLKEIAIWPALPRGPHQTRRSKFSWCEDPDGSGKWYALPTLGLLLDLVVDRRLFLVSANVERQMGAIRTATGTASTDLISPPSSNRDEARRLLQQRENKLIQDIDRGFLVPSHLTVDEMVDRCIYIAEGKCVAYIFEGRSLFLRFEDFCGHTRGAKSERENLSGVRKLHLNAVLWQEHRKRQSAMTATFGPGRDIITADPKGLRAVNTWRPILRWPAAADITPFLVQVKYLFPDPIEREVFLDWLAHIEQYPGVLPHYGWLHIAERTGTGRNWLASVLARVFRGQVAPNVDLPNLLESQFNGELSGRVLAIVDEIQVGGMEDSFRYAQRLKSMVNAEMRTINNKYGLKYNEFNACRWFVFSNHRNALPLNDDDRRFRVVLHQSPPRPAEVYAELYRLVEDAEFINAVGCFLRERDISRFMPGERPPLSQAKLAAIAASKPMSTQNAEEIVAAWPADVITTRVLGELLSESDNKQFTPAMRRAMEEAGAQGREKKVRIGEFAQRVWVLRSHERWLAESTDAIRLEVARARVDETGGRSAAQVLAEAIDKRDGGSPF